MKSQTIVNHLLHCDFCAAWNVLWVLPSLCTDKTCFSCSWGMLSWLSVCASTVSHIAHCTQMQEVPFWSYSTVSLAHWAWVFLYVLPSRGQWAGLYLWSLWFWNRGIYVQIVASSGCGIFTTRPLLWAAAHPALGLVPHFLNSKI